MIRHGPGKAVRVRRGSARHTVDDSLSQAPKTSTAAQLLLPSTTISTVRSSATSSSAHNDDNDVVTVPTEDQPVSLTSSSAIAKSNTAATRSPRPSPLVASLKLPCEAVCRTSVAPIGTTTTAAAVKMWQEQLELYPMLRLVPLQFVLEQRYSQWREGQSSPTLPVTTSNTIESNSQPVPNIVPRDSSYAYALAASCPQLDLSASYEVPRSLRAVLWGGCKPDFLRATLWRVLCDYAPTTLTRQRDELQRKRALYRSYTTYYYNNNNSNNSNGQSEEGYMDGAAESQHAQRQVDDSASHTPPSLRPVSATRAESTSHTAASQTNLSSAPKDNAAGTARGANMPSLPLSGASSMKPGSPLRWGLATSLTRSERAMQSQIALDLPRHEATLFKCALCVNALARCLFLWAQRHPAVGYVQGMDDIVCVFYELFLSEAIVQVAMERQTSSEEHKVTTSVLHVDPTSAHVRQGGGEGVPDTRIEQQHQQSSAERERCAASVSLQLLRRRLTLQLSMNPTLLTRLPHTELETAVATLPESYLLQVEADTYWCADRLLGQLQDNFTPGLPGMTRNATQLERLLRSANAGALLDRLASQGVTLMNGCFQWLHCLLARELPLHLLFSLWDTYFAMGSDDWPRFHLYVCAALLLSLRQVLSRVATEQILQLLRSPFAASLAQLTPASRPVVHRASDATSATPSQWQARRAEAKREAQWLELLIADAYRLWRLYPHAVQG